MGTYGKYNDGSLCGLWIDLSRYFDYEAFGCELFMYDYTMGANNNVFGYI